MLNSIFVKVVIMIKVLPGRYFASVEENHAMNRYIIENFGYGNFTINALDSYFKEKYNAVYVPGEVYSNDPGYFLFEDSKDAIMFILRWS